MSTAEINERAQNILKNLAQVESDALEAAAKLTKECDLDAQTELFFANASVAPVVFARAQSKAKSIYRLRVIASDAMEARIRALKNFTQFRTLEDSEYAFQVSLVNSEAESLAGNLESTLEGIKESVERYG